MKSETRKTILLVEDDPISAKLVIRMVEKMGYHVTQCLSSGEEAIDHVQTFCPDLVLMDIHLAGKLDGIETAQQIKQSVEVPIIYLTAMGDPVTVQRAVSTEPFGYIMKPIQEPMLKSTIELALIKFQGLQYINNSRKWMASILNNINDALIAVDHTGKVSYINHAGFETLPIHFDHSIGKPLHQTITLFLDHGYIAYTNREGDRRYVDLTYSLLIENGSFEGVLWVLRDVTEHVIAQEELRIHNQWLNALHQTTLKLMEDRSITRVVQAIFDRAHQIFGTPHGFLCLEDPKNHLMSMEVGTGLFKDTKGVSIQKGDGFVGKIWQDEKILIVEDYPHWVHRKTWVDEGILSMIGVPLIHQKRVLGVLGLGFSDHTHIFSRLESQIIEQFAQLATIAIDNAQLFEMAQKEIQARKCAQEALQLDESRLETLYNMTQMVNKPNHTIIDFALEEGVRLTKSQFGFLGFVNAQQDRVEIHSWSQRLVESDPQRFSNTQPSVKHMPILDEVLQKRKTVLCNRLKKDAINELPEDHIDLSRFMIIPIFDGPQMVAVVSVANKELAYNDADVRQITLLLNGMWRILEKKRIDEEVAYMSIHDGLTGLYNRGYFEEEMKRLSNGRQNPLGLIICDVDGLKTINDTYGHAFGDQILVAASQVLKASFRKGDMIARIGGDEFAVLVPKTSEESMKKACQRLNRTMEAYNQDHSDIPLHVSIGYSIRSYPQTSMESLFLAADNHMYQEKAHKKQTVRSPLTSTLCKILEERGIFPKEYGDLLEKWAVDLAKEIDAPSIVLQDLPKFTRIHDIGKVGIPEKILLKPTSLTDREFRKMMEHAVIGHQIAVSTPDLLSIADWVLNHHEWWNGKGYPNKVHGEEIPLACRILSVVDTYLDMVYPWAHKKNAKWYLAYEHLQYHSGSQFEPRIVEAFLRMARSDPQYQRIIIS